MSIPIHLSIYQNLAPGCSIAHQTKSMTTKPIQPLWVKAKWPYGHSVKFRDPDGWWEAMVKWDGCIDLNKAFNEPFSDTNTDPDCDSIHICSIDEMIERLQSLKAMAIAQFGEDWE